jgi:hypothetical protein
MAKLDHGYSQTRTSGGRGGRGGRGRGGMTIDTYLSQTKKAEVADLYVRTATHGILDVLGIDPGDDTDLAMKIRQGVRDSVGKDRMTKADLGAGWTSATQDGNQASRRQQEIERNQAAETLLNALYSATRMRERTDLEDGDLLDDPTSLLTDGDGWGEEATGRLEVRKHVSLAIDNSGSTHMPETGYCSRAMSNVADNLLRVLFDAASTYPGLTYDGFSFNRVAKIHTGRWAREQRAQLVRDYFAGVIVADPLRADAVETNLAPLIEEMYRNEERQGLIGSPRLDIILTDGEFESEADADEAAEWQRKRGLGVTTYVLNLCPGEIDDPVSLPHQFRVVPVDCLTGADGSKAVDQDILRQTLNRIAVAEVSRLD